MRPAILNDQPRRGNIRALTNLVTFHGGTIARADVAAFVTEQLTSDAFLGKRPLIA